MYRYTITNVKDSGELTPPAVGYTLVETHVYQDKLIVIWVAGYDNTDVEWGDTTWAMREINDPVSIAGNG